MRASQSGRQVLSIPRLLLVCLTASGLAVSSPAQLLFGPPTSTPLGDATSESIAAGDVNGDLFADLVVGHEGAPGLRLGDGAGHFGPEATIAVGATGSTVALADLDAEGGPEILVGSSLTGQLFVSEWETGGSFGPAAAYALGVVTSSANTLSLDVRESLGVLAITAGAIGGPAGEARVFRVEPSGLLVLVGVITPAVAGQRIVGGFIGSLNGDGLPDVVLQLDAGTSAPDLTVAAYVAQPGGTFLTTWSVGGQTLGRLGHLWTGGGGLDLVTLGSSGGVPAILTHVGVGDGSFVSGAVSEIPTTEGVSICGLTDLDQNYITDLIAVREHPAELWIMRDTGEGAGGAFVMNARVTLSSAAPALAAGRALLGDFDEGGGPNNFDAVVPIGLGTATPSAKVCFNRTYPGGLPLLDLGHQLKGTSWPILIVEGSFVAGQPVSFALSGALPSGPAFVVAGLSVLEAPFKGGTMVPHPLLIFGPWPVAPSGQLTLTDAAWSGGPSGLVLALQFWVQDPNGPAGFAASSAVRITLP